MVTIKMAQQPKNLGIIAGDLELPEKIISTCKKDTKYTPFVVNLVSDRNKNSKIFDTEHINLNIGQVGKAIKFFRNNTVEDIVFAGNIKKPSLLSIKTDLKGAKLLAKITKEKLSGDNSLLSCVLEFFELEGFNIKGVHDILPEILAPKGCLTKTKPNSICQDDIDSGSVIVKAVGKLDIGQAIIFQQGSVIGVEAIEGSDALIQRCKKLKLKGPGGTFIKICKPSQDKRIDLPTIGPKTIDNIIKAGFAGIAIEANKTILIDKETLIEKADAHKIFVVGF